MRCPPHTVVLIALMVLQTLLAPTLFASGAPAQSLGAASHCLDHAGEGSHHSPCCPSGVTVAGCMSFCTACAPGFGLVLPVLGLTPLTSTAFVPPGVSTQTYAPPNPPPIR